ncbi:MAG TPA: hypothetical protein VFI90_17265 [Rubrobacter sp.]|nr:hypothetical protein [Rubrobacter sp.]
MFGLKRKGPSKAFDMPTTASDSIRMGGMALSSDRHEKALDRPFHRAARAPDAPKRPISF